MSLQIRKIVRYVDETLIEGGKAAERPWIMAEMEVDQTGKPASG